jgi:hypothetical protein
MSARIQKPGVLYDVLPSADAASLLFAIPGPEHPDALDVAKAFPRQGIVRWDRAVATVARRRQCDIADAEDLLARALRDPRGPLTSQVSPRTNCLFVSRTPDVK